MFRRLFAKFLTENTDEPKYRCVHCRHRLRELTQTYSPTIQRLAMCEKCEKVADNYIEFEG